MEVALFLIDQATEVYEHGPVQLRDTTFEVAFMAAEAAMVAMKEGNAAAMLAIQNALGAREVGIAAIQDPAISNEDGHACMLDGHQTLRVLPPSLMG